MFVSHKLTHRLWWLVGISALIAFPAVAFAVVAQGYQFTGTPLAGALVAVDSPTGTAAVLATVNDVSDLTGVIVVPGGTTLLAGSDQALVTSTGVAYALVSDINGPISKGDYLTASQVAGVAAKATVSGRMLGTAQAAFTGHESGDTQQTIGSGVSQRSVHIGQIPVQLDIGSVTLDSNGAAAYIPLGVQRLADELAGHSVSALRLLLAGLLLLVGLVGASVILSSAVRSSMLSIGRNPLSSRSVYRGLTQVGFLTIVLLAICLSAMYLVIRL